MTAKRFFAATNAYATRTSIGFENTWDVLAFGSRADRDAYVASATDMATRAITRREVTRYAANWSLTRDQTNKPKPFSGEYWGIDDMTSYDAPRGLLGQVVVCEPTDTYPSLF